MRISKNISLAVLVGVAMGLAANLYTPNIVALGASGPADPNPAIKVVTHNATLTGDGTTTVPLGIANGGVGTIQIANGAVTSAKIGAGSPTAGQLLSFNGTGLAWQTPSLGGVRVVDNLGHDVGPFIDTIVGARILRRMGAFAFLLVVDRNGFGNNGLSFAHTTPDCSGPRYLPGEGTSLFRQSQNNDTQVFFAAEPLQELLIRSFEDVQDPNQPGTCRSGGGVSSVGLATSMSLSALGLTPPFHLEF